MSFRLSVHTAERTILNGDASFVVIPGADGDFGVLPGHSPMLTAVRPGALHVEWVEPPADGSDSEPLFVAGGFVEVLPDCVTVMADVVERASEIDVEHANAARESAQAGIEDVRGARVSALAIVERETARLRVAELHRHHRGKIAPPVRLRELDEANDASH